MRTVRSCPCGSRMQKFCDLQSEIVPTARMLKLAPSELTITMLHVLHSSLSENNQYFCRYFGHGRLILSSALNSLWNNQRIEYWMAGSMHYVMKCDTRRRTQRLPSLHFSTPTRYDSLRYHDCQA